MKQSINALPINPLTIQHLLKAGFIYTNELEEIGALELSQELNISKVEAINIVNMIKNITADLNPSINSSSASSGTNKIVDNQMYLFPEALNSLEFFGSTQCKPISTSSSNLDRMLGGGILYSLTEFSGVSGVGKSQLVFQLSVNACLMDSINEVVFIDTEGSFIATRIKQIAELTLKRLKEDESKLIEDIDFNSILSRIHHFRCLDIIELISTVYSLIDFVSERIANGGKVRLLILDSIAFPFRMEMNDLKLRSRLLLSVSQSLIDCIHKFRLAVILTNHMTLRVKYTQDSIAVQHAPALGESWAHIPTRRVILFWVGGGIRNAKLVKSPDQPEMTVAFNITGEGIRD